MKRCTKSCKTGPPSDPLTHGAQTTYLPPILAKWANTSPESVSQRTNQGSPSSDTPRSVSSERPSFHMTATRRWKCTSSCCAQSPRRQSTSTKRTMLLLTSVCQGVDGCGEEFLHSSFVFCLRQDKEQKSEVSDSVLSASVLSAWPERNAPG